MVLFRQKKQNSKIQHHFYVCQNRHHLIFIPKRNFLIAPIHHNQKKNQTVI